MRPAGNSAGVASSLFHFNKNKDLDSIFAQQVGMLCKSCRCFVLSNAHASHLPCSDLKCDLARSWRPIGAAGARVVAAISSGSNTEAVP
jgi:hypothetical protein